MSFGKFWTSTNNCDSTFRFFFWRNGPAFFLGSFRRFLELRKRLSDELLWGSRPKIPLEHSCRRNKRWLLCDQTKLMNLFIKTIWIIQNLRTPKTYLNSYCWLWYLKFVTLNIYKYVDMNWIITGCHHHPYVNHLKMETFYVSGSQSGSSTSSLSSKSDSVKFIFNTFSYIKGIFFTWLS